MNIRQIDSWINIHYNVGVSSINWVGDFTGFGTVWYHKNSIANILSLTKVKQLLRVIYDSGNGDGFVVHKTDGKKRSFRELRKGLFFHDACNQDATVLVNTVEDKK